MRFDVDVDGVALSGAAAREPRQGDGGAFLQGRSVQVSVPAPGSRFYRHGWQSWSPTWWVDSGSRPASSPLAHLRVLGDDPVHADAERHGGSAVGALALDDGRVVLLGALGLGGRVELDADGALAGRYEQGDGDWFATSGSEQEAFERYATELGQRFGSRKRPTPRVWCSWYSFYTDITEGRLLEVLVGLEGLSFDLFQIDDGWQVEIGDWQPNGDFPSGMDGLAAKARSAGYRAGIWIAPFIAHERSGTFRAHPEWFVQDPDGGPTSAGVNWGGRFHALDLTHPGARDHVAGVIREAVGWGYDYLKLDFLYAAALPGRRHADDGREQVYRSGVELVREVAGDDVYLLACGAPVIPSVGVFDGVRVGPDVAPWWEQDLVTHHLRALAGPNARYAIITSAHRLWLQPVIDTDPDVAYFRTRYNLLDPEQRRWLQDLARVARFKATSDPPSWLDDDERAALATFLDEDVEVRRLDHYRYSIGEREVDFSELCRPRPDLLSE